MELKEHQKKVIDSIRNEKKPIYFSFPVTKNIDFEKQREGRMHRENRKIIDILENKKQFLDNYLVNNKHGWQYRICWSFLAKNICTLRVLFL